MPLFVVVCNLILGTLFADPLEQIQMLRLVNRFRRRVRRSQIAAQPRHNHQDGRRHPEDKCEPSCLSVRCHVSPSKAARSMSPGPDFRGTNRERCVSYFTLRRLSKKCKVAKKNPMECCRWLWWRQRRGRPLECGPSQCRDIPAAVANDSTHESGQTIVSGYRRSRRRRDRRHSRGFF